MRRNDYVLCPRRGAPIDTPKELRRKLIAQKDIAKQRRFWELTGRIAYCGGCGKTMCANHSTKTKKGRIYTYDYYCCSQRNRYGPDICANSHRPRAGELEATVWNLVCGLLKDPARLRAGLEGLIEEERRAMRGNPDKEAEAWAKKLAEVDSKRSAYQDQQAEGLITLDELRTKLAALEETRAVALKEVKALRARREQLERLEHDAEALLEHYAEMIPEALDDLTPEERRDVYKMMRLKVLIFSDGSVEVTGVFGGPLEVGASPSMKTEDSW
jgi:site-specific DNA recombinase